MKKVKFFAIALLAFVAISLANTAFAETDEELALRLRNNSTPVWLLEAMHCKDVTYSPWSACLPGFNLQIRYIVDTPAGCLASTKQQVETLRFCDSQEFFGYSIK